MRNEHIAECGRIRNDMVQAFNATLEERVQRYLEVDHQKITPNHHFAAASAECLRLYVDGHFMGTVMMTQAVAEGIRRFVLERNCLKLGEGVDGPDAVAQLRDDGVITPQCAEALERIWRSFRNDVHHMNPKVATIPLRQLAQSNIKDLALIEREIFAVKVVTGAFVPVQPKYWDIKDDGTTAIFLRCSP